MKAYLLRDDQGKITLVTCSHWDSYTTIYRSRLAQKRIDLSDSLFQALTDNQQSESTQSYLRELWNGD